MRRRSLRSKTSGKSSSPAVIQKWIPTVGRGNRNTINSRRSVESVKRWLSLELSPTGKTSSTRKRSRSTDDCSNVSGSHENEKGRRNAHENSDLTEAVSKNPSSCLNERKGVTSSSTLDRTNSLAVSKPTSKPEESLDVQGVSPWGKPEGVLSSMGKVEILTRSTTRNGLRSTSSCGRTSSSSVRNKSHSPIIPSSKRRRTLSGTKSVQQMDGDNQDANKDGDGASPKETDNLSVSLSSPSKKDGKAGSRKRSKKRVTRMDRGDEENSSSGRGEPDLSAPSADDATTSKTVLSKNATLAPLNGNDNAEEKTPLGDGTIKNKDTEDPTSRCLSAVPLGQYESMMVKVALPPSLEPPDKPVVGDVTRVDDTRSKQLSNADIETRAMANENVNIGQSIAVTQKQDSVVDQETDEGRRDLTADAKVITTTASVSLSSLKHHQKSNVGDIPHGNGIGLQQQFSDEGEAKTPRPSAVSLTGDFSRCNDCVLQEKSKDFKDRLALERIPTLSKNRGQSVVDKEEKRATDVEEKAFVGSQKADGRRVDLEVVAEPKVKGNTMLQPSTDGHQQRNSDIIRPSLSEEAAAFPKPLLSSPQKDRYSSRTDDSLSFDGLGGRDNLENSERDSFLSKDKERCHQKFNRRREKESLTSIAEGSRNGSNSQKSDHSWQKSSKDKMEAPFLEGTTHSSALPLTDGCREHDLSSYKASSSVEEADISLQSLPPSTASPIQTLFTIDNSRTFNAARSVLAGRDETALVSLKDDELPSPDSPQEDCSSSREENSPINPSETDRYQQDVSTAETVVHNLEMTSIPAVLPCTEGSGKPISSPNNEADCESGEVDLPLSSSSLEFTLLSSRKRTSSLVNACGDRMSAEDPESNTALGKGECSRPSSSAKLLESSVSNGKDTDRSEDVQETSIFREGQSVDEREEQKSSGSNSHNPAPAALLPCTGGPRQEEVGCHASLVAPRSSSVETAQEDETVSDCAINREERKTSFFSTRLELGKIKVTAVDKHSCPEYESVKQGEHSGAYNSKGLGRMNNPAFVTPTDTVENVAHCGRDESTASNTSTGSLNYRSRSCLQSHEDLAQVEQPLPGALSNDIPTKETLASAEVDDAVDVSSPEFQSDIDQIKKRDETVEFTANRYSEASVTGTGSRTLEVKENRERDARSEDEILNNCLNSVERDASRGESSLHGSDERRGTEPVFVVANSSDFVGQETSCHGYSALHDGIEAANSIHGRLVLGEKEGLRCAEKMSKKCDMESETIVSDASSLCFTKQQCQDKAFETFSLNNCMSPASVASYSDKIGNRLSRKKCTPCRRKEGSMSINDTAPGTLLSSNGSRPAFDKVEIVACLPCPFQVNRDRPQMSADIGKTASGTDKECPWKNQLSCFKEKKMASSSPANARECLSGFRGVGKRQRKSHRAENSESFCGNKDSSTVTTELASKMDREVRRPALLSNDCSLCVGSIFLDKSTSIDSKYVTLSDMVTDSHSNTDAKIVVEKRTLPVAAATASSVSKADMQHSPSSVGKRTRSESATERAEYSAALMEEEPHDRETSAVAGAVSVHQKNRTRRRNEILVQLSNRGNAVVEKDTLSFAAAASVAATSANETVPKSATIRGRSPSASDAAEFSSMLVDSPSCSDSGHCAPEEDALLSESPLEKHILTKAICSMVPHVKNGIKKDPKVAYLDSMTKDGTVDHPKMLESMETGRVREKSAKRRRMEIDKISSKLSKKNEDESCTFCLKLDKGSAEEGNQECDGTDKDSTSKDSTSTTVDLVDEANHFLNQMSTNGKFPDSGFLQADKDLPQHICNSSGYSYKHDTSPLGSCLLDSESYKLGENRNHFENNYPKRTRQSEAQATKDISSPLGNDVNFLRKEAAEATCTDGNTMTGTSECQAISGKIVINTGIENGVMARASQSEPCISQKAGIASDEGYLLDRKLRDGELAKETVLYWSSEDEGGSVCVALSNAQKTPRKLLPTMFEVECKKGHSMNWESETKAEPFVHRTEFKKMLSGKELAIKLRQGGDRNCSQSKGEVLALNKHSNSASGRNRKVKRAAREVKVGRSHQSTVAAVCDSSTIGGMAVVLEAPCSHLLDPSKENKPKELQDGGTVVKERRRRGRPKKEIAQKNKNGIMSKRPLDMRQKIAINQSGGDNPTDRCPVSENDKAVHNEKECDVVDTCYYSDPTTDEKKAPKVVEKVFKKATEPKFRSREWTIWREFCAPAALGERIFVFGESDSFKPYMENDPKTDALSNYNFLIEPNGSFPNMGDDSDLTSKYNFHVVHRVAQAKICAGMYCSSIKVCQNALIDWYEAAQELMTQALRSRETIRGAIKQISAMRNSLAGMWCVYVHVLIEINCKYGRTLNAKASAFAKSPKRLGVKKIVGNSRGASVRWNRGSAAADSECEAQLDRCSYNIATRAKTAVVNSTSSINLESNSKGIVDDAIQLLRKASCCPLVGNHACLWLARSRLELSKAFYIAAECGDFESQMDCGTSEDKDVCRLDVRDGCKERTHLKLTQLLAALNSAIMTCKEGLSSPAVTSMPTYGPNVNVQETKCEGILNILDRCCRPSCKDCVLWKTRETLTTETSKLNVKLNSIATQSLRFADEHGAKLLCKEVNFLYLVRDELVKQNAANEQTVVGYRRTLANGTNASRSWLDFFPFFAARHRCFAFSNERKDGEEHMQHLSDSDQARNVSSVNNISCAALSAERKTVKSKAGCGQCNGVDVLVSCLMERSRPEGGTSFAEHRSYTEESMTRKAAIGEKRQTTRGRDYRSLSRFHELIQCCLAEESNRLHFCCDQREWSSAPAAALCAPPEWGCDICKSATFLTLHDLRLHKDCCKKQQQSSQMRCGSNLTTGSFQSFECDQGRSGKCSIPLESGEPIFDHYEAIDVLDYLVELFTATEGNCFLKRTATDGTLVLGGERHFQSPSSAIENITFLHQSTFREGPSIGGHVGLRCLYCRNASAEVQKGSFLFQKPQTPLHKTMWHLCVFHLDSCPNIPEHARLRYEALRYKIGLDSLECQQYWTEVFKEFQSKFVRN